MKITFKGVIILITISILLGAIAGEIAAWHWLQRSTLHDIAILMAKYTSLKM